MWKFVKYNPELQQKFLQIGESCVETGKAGPKASRSPAFLTDKKLGIFKPIHKVAYYYMCDSSYHITSTR